jgi:hypothetical protein
MGNQVTAVDDGATDQVRYLQQLGGYVDEMKAGLDQVDGYNQQATAENPGDPTAQEYNSVIRGSDQTAAVIDASSTVMDENGQGGHQALQGIEGAASEAATEAATSFEPTDRPV